MTYIKTIYSITKRCSYCHESVDISRNDASMITLSHNGEVYDAWLCDDCADYISKLPIFRQEEVIYGDQDYKDRWDCVQVGHVSI